jgi:glycosyltransferase involved in cell wall biosynthesis
LDAFERISEYRPDWDLVIVGDGPLRQELQARVPMRVRDRIKWLGFLQFEELISCYHSCDALVLPSEREPWALVINEAVASGLPVIATEVVGAAAELVRHGLNGLLVPPRNLEALVKALIEITNPDRNQQMRGAAPAILQQWRIAADPVEGVRQALRYFHVIL